MLSRSYAAPMATSRVGRLNVVGSLTENGGHFTSGIYSGDTNMRKSRLIVFTKPTKLPRPMEMTEFAPCAFAYSRASSVIYVECATRTRHTTLDKQRAPYAMFLQDALMELYPVLSHDWGGHIHT